MQYCANISYGKDSLAMLHVITDILHKPLDRIITAEVWATDTIQADLPPMVEFKDKADEIILKRWGIKVERFCAVNNDGSKQTYEKCFYRKYAKGARAGEIYGFPRMQGAWCNSKLKMSALNMVNKSKGKADVSYIGIAADEPIRIDRHKGKQGIEMPLVEAGWTEQMCRSWCEENGLLSPLYATSARGGCWFCHNQGVEQMRSLRSNYPDLWKILLQWDTDTPEYVTFKPGKRTVHDYEQRFQMEEQGFFGWDKFRWETLQHAQMNIDQFLDK